MKGDLERQEEAIGRVLGALREAEASPGLEGRVMAALEGRVEADELSRSGRGWGDGWGGGWFAGARGSGVGRVVFAAALLCAAGVGGVVALRHGVERHSRGRVNARGSEDLRASGVRPRVGSGASVAGGIVIGGAARVMARGGDVEPGSSRRHAAGVVVVRGEIGWRGGQVVGGVRGDVSGREVASFPAPPLPLTEQERLLLRVVHRGDTQEIAMLDPVVRLAEARRERAQFKEFFAPEVVAAAEPAPSVSAAAEVPASQSSGEAGATPVYVEPAAGSGLGERWNAKARMTRRRR